MSSRFRIGDLTLDTGRRLLLRDTKTIPLGPLTYRLLLTLVEAAPNVVSQDQLIDSIWGGRPVSPETISQRIKLLRDALSDDPHSPRYIQLVRGQGYRLLPGVEILPSESPARRWARWVTPIGISTSIVIAVAVVFWIAASPTGAVRESSSVAMRDSSSTPVRNSSIAVLPFADLSPAQDEQYLADGIAEEILNLLSSATTLRVVARTSSFSFRGKEADVRRIAEVLGVTHVLEGSVRKEEERIRVTVRLVDASDGSRLWSESYDQRVGNIIQLQTDVAGSVAAALKSTLQDDVNHVAARLVNAQAYDLYLRGQQKLGEYSSAEAGPYFEQAIAIDPEFIPGYYSLGLAYVLQVVDGQAPVAENREKLRDVLRRGMRLAPEDPGLRALSGQLARYDGEMQLAEERFATALRKDPSNIVVRSLYPIFKLDQSYPEEALALNRRSLEIDPLNPINYIVIWASAMDLWDTEQAIAAAAHYRERAAPLDETGEMMTGIARMMILGDLAGTIGDFRKAVARRERAGRPNPTGLALIYYSIGDVQTADALVASIHRNSWKGARLIYAYQHLVHGNVDEARRVAVSELTKRKKVWGGEHDRMTLRLAVDAMLESGEAQRAVDFVEALAPEYARYRTRKDIDPKDFSPAPVPVKSGFSSYPAAYFPDYIRVLRAVGDEAGANQMLDHLEAILELRRKRGLFIEERHAAEALALRGRTEAALDALEKAERDRTIYLNWHLLLLHNEIFAGFRDHPRFVALVERIQRDLSRQRDELSRIDRAATQSNELSGLAETTTQ